MLEQYSIAEQLGETAPQALALIGRIVRELGNAEARRFLVEAQRINAEGGMLTEDGTRRRTLGGTFFYLVKEHLRTTGNTRALNQLFPGRPRRNARMQPPALHSQAATPHVEPSATFPPLPTRLRPRMRNRLEPSAAAPPAEPAVQAARPANQAEVLAVLDRHLGVAGDIYRRSYHPESGAVTLHAYFPAIARERYADALADATRELNLSIAISDRPHQGMLIAAAQALLPDGLPIVRASIEADRETVRVSLPELPDQHETAALKEQFRRSTGWNLELVVDQAPAPAAQSTSSDAALRYARQQLPPDTGCYAIGAHLEAHTLVVRFAFPDVARERYTDQIDAIERTTGWHVVVHPSPHQELLAAAARRALPAGLVALGAASLRFNTRQVALHYRGVAGVDAIEQARAQFSSETGWQLELAES
jgi:hypothetical protein